MIKTLALVLGLQLMSSDKPDLKHSEISAYCLRFKTLLVDIREMTKTPDEARNEFQEIMKGLAEAYKNEKFDSAKVAITFPMRLIDYRRVGGSNGNGYFPKSFDLFDHKKKGSHPAQDIFLRDANADAIDDRLGVPLELVATTDGLVIAVEQNWQKDSEYRGGNYAWIYDYKNKGLWYYAHASKISVSPGDEVLAGDEIGITGRTGFNAAKLRSETHLHLMFLKIGDDFLPKPMNTYPWLKQAKTIAKLNEKRPEIRKTDFGILNPMEARKLRIPFLDLRMASDRPNFKIG
jgi:peptidoglycan LD-endopeptidase LytH